MIRLPAWGLVRVDSMSDLVTRLRAEDVNEPLDRLLDEAADRIKHPELALVEGRLIVSSHECNDAADRMPRGGRGKPLDLN